MNIKMLLIMGLLSMLGIGGANAQAKEDMRKESALLIKSEIDFDSLRATYANMPVYYIEYSNRGCDYDIRVNDLIVVKAKFGAASGGTLIPINTNILESGKQTFSIHLSSPLGEEPSKSEVHFSFKIGYQDIMPGQENAPMEWHWIYEQPALKFPKGNLSDYEIKGEFEAKVPYCIHSAWRNCISLDKIPDIEDKARSFFNKMRKMMIEKDYESLRKEYWDKYHNIAVMSYQTNKEFEENFSHLYKSMEKGSKEDFPVIDQSSIPVYYCNKRLISLEFVKDEDWFCSALIWIKDMGSYWDFTTFELYLGIKEGSQELTMIL